MLEICSTCGNHEWDKKVEGNKIRCPKCGNEWTCLVAESLQRGCEKTQPIKKGINEYKQ